jgi:hypothetical protein
MGRDVRASTAGEFRELDGIWYVYLPHPAFVMRGAWSEEPGCVRTLQRAWHYATSPEKPPSVDYSKPPAGAVLAPRLADLTAWEHHIGPAGIAVDLETAGDHIRLVGLCTVDPPHMPLVLPFRVQGGGAYWTDWAEFQAAVRWLWGLLADPTLPKVFHNGQAFDTPVLELNGFVVKNFDFDTMLAQHVAFPEMSKGLEFMAKLYLGVPGWKSLVKAEGDGEGK